jgi:hypothetical protein
MVAKLKPKLRLPSNGWSARSTFPRALRLAAERRLQGVGPGSSRRARARRGGSLPLRRAARWRANVHDHDIAAVGRLPGVRFRDVPVSGSGLRGRSRDRHRHARSARVYHNRRAHHAARNCAHRGRRREWERTLPHRVSGFALGGTAGRLARDPSPMVHSRSSRFPPTGTSLRRGWTARVRRRWSSLCQAASPTRGAISSLAETEALRRVRAIVVTYEIPVSVSPRESVRNPVLARDPRHPPAVLRRVQIARSRRLAPSPSAPDTRARPRFRAVGLVVDRSRDRPAFNGSA